LWVVLKTIGFLVMSLLRRKPPNDPA